MDSENGIATVQAERIRQMKKTMFEVFTDSCEITKKDVALHGSVEEAYLMLSDRDEQSHGVFASLEEARAMLNKVASPCTRDYGRVYVADVAFITSGEYNDEEVSCEFVSGVDYCEFICSEPSDEQEDEEDED